MSVLSRIAALASVVVVCLWLAACTTLSSTGVALLEAAPVSGPEVPASEAIGSGGIVVGVIIAEAGSKSPEGAINSLQLAARLAAVNANSDRVRFELRNIDASISAARRAGAEMAEIGASVVIAGLDARGTLAIREGIKNPDVPILSLARDTSSQRATYWAGYNPLEEAAAIAQEAARRGIGTLIVAATDEPQSRRHSAALVAMAQQAGLSVLPVSIASGGDLARHLQANPVEQNTAVVCTLSATGCQNALEPGGGLPVFPLPQMIGNSAWAISGPPPSASSGWYPVPAASSLAAYVEKFRSAYGVSPTLDSALFYDLVILAGALPRIVETGPYAPGVLANDQGFEGFS